MMSATLDRPLTDGVADPFPHFVGSQFLSASQACDLLAAIDAFDRWTLMRDRFYEHWSVELHNSAWPAERSMGNPLIMQAYERGREAVHAHFAAELSDDSQILAHRMNHGHRIEPHNDAPPLGFETFRVILYLDDPFPGQGELSLHADSNARASRVYRPRPGLAVGLAFSRRSFHSVGALAQGARTTLAFNYWHKGNSPAVERAICAHVEALRASRGEDAAELALLLTSCRAIGDAKLARAAYLAALTHASQGASRIERDALFLALVDDRYWGSAPILAGREATARAAAMHRAFARGEAVEAAACIARWIGHLAHGIFEPARWSAERTLLARCARNLAPESVEYWSSILFD
jgi:hypothetical protein